MQGLRGAHGVLGRWQSLPGALYGLCSNDGLTPFCLAQQHVNQQQQQQQQQLCGWQAASFSSQSAPASAPAASGRTLEEASSSQPPTSTSGTSHSGSSSSSSSSPAAVQPLSGSTAPPYYRSRAQQFYQEHLARELLLKLNVRSVHDLPRIRMLTAHISAKDLYAKTFVDKWQMLLPALALEYISGRPAVYATSKQKYYRARNVVTGVYIKLHGVEAADFLEKLTVLVLPSQNAFDGVLMRQLDISGHLHFRVPKMINFPDFEEMFETFEALTSMHVTVVMQNTSRRPKRSQLLMTGLQMPLLTKRKLVGQPDEAFANVVVEGGGQDGQ